MSTTITKKHSSKNSHDSTTLLPSLCSSISSYNSSLSTLTTTQKQPRKRWDDSQFAIELCDDHLLKTKSNSSYLQKHKHLNHSTTAKHLKKKLSTSFFSTTTTATSSTPTATDPVDTMTTNHSASSLHSNHSNKKMSLSLKRLKSLISL